MATALRVVPLSIAIILAGCATVQLPEVKIPTLHPKLAPVRTPILSKAWEERTQCAAPSPAKLTFGDSFRYGCFCGLGHPQVSGSGDELIAAYYRIMAIDQIDAACRDHDVCWIMRGDGDGHCNGEFSNRLHYLSKQFNRDYIATLRPPAKANLTAEACDVMALDMAAGFQTVFVEHEYKDRPLASALFYVARLLYLPIHIGVVPALRAVTWITDPYPKPEERCFVSVSLPAAWNP